MLFEFSIHLIEGDNFNIEKLKKIAEEHPCMFRLSGEKELAFAVCGDSTSAKDWEEKYKNFNIKRLASIGYVCFCKDKIDIFQQYARDPIPKHLKSLIAPEINKREIRVQDGCGKDWTDNYNENPKILFS